MIAETTKLSKTDKRVLDKISHFLKEVGLRPIHLARKLGYDDSWSSYLMRGERSLTINQLLKIAKILKVKPSSLLPKDEDEFESTEEFEEVLWQMLKPKVEKLFKKNK